MSRAGSAEARRRFPGLDHAASFDEVTVVDDAGQVHRGPAARIIVLWARREHRALAHRLSTPAGARPWGGPGYRRADGRGYEPRLGPRYTGPPGPAAAAAPAPLVRLCCCAREERRSR